MLIFDQAQCDALSNQAFVERLCAAWRVNHPASFACENLRLLAPWILKQAALARSYFLLDELSASIFVTAAWLLGGGFDLRIPKMNQVLNDPLLTAEEKCARISTFLVAVFDILGSGDQS